MRTICVKILYVSIVIVFAAQGHAAEPLQPLTIQLDWITNVESAGILLAKEQRWYKEAGIDLTIKGWQSEIVPVEEVMAGKAHIGVAEGGTLIKARAQGKAVKAISALFQRSPFCLISKKEQGIKTPDQLVGKRIGMKHPQAELMIEIVLANVGKGLEDVIPVQTGFELDPLIHDEVDVFPGYLNDEPLIMEELGYEVTSIPAFQYGYDFYASILFTTETMIQEQPDLLQAFWVVTQRGWKAAFQDPAATAQLVVEKYYPEGSVQQQIQSLKIFQGLMTWGIGEDLLGLMEEEFWAKGVDILYTYQQIEKKIPAKDLFTLQFLKK